MIYLALCEHEDAIDLVEAFLQYNDNTVERGLYYQAVHAVLEVTLHEGLELEDYLKSFDRMFGEATMRRVIGSMTGELRFDGLTQTSMKLEGLDKHLRLIESYKKLHQARGNSK